MKISVTKAFRRPARLPKRFVLDKIVVSVDGNPRWDGVGIYGVIDGDVLQLRLVDVDARNAPEEGEFQIIRLSGRWGGDTLQLSP